MWLCMRNYESFFPVFAIDEACFRAGAPSFCRNNFLFIMFFLQLWPHAHNSQDYIDMEPFLSCESVMRACQCSGFVGASYKHITYITNNKPPYAHGLWGHNICSCICSGRRLKLLLFICSH